MRIIIIILILLVLMTAAFSGAMDGIEGPKTCKRCNMDRTAFAQSRMLIVYGDETTAGVCSLHCAAEELQQNKDKQVSSLMVADYVTKKLLNARAAFWVVGGRQRGVMTALPKWAFAKAGDARRFVKEYSGSVGSFDQAMNYATREVTEQIAEQRAVESELLRERRQRVAPGR